VINCNYISGEYGRIYKGELIDNSNKCIIKTLQTENATQQNREEYSREIESKKKEKKYFILKKFHFYYF
jgi:hypothetical protein